MDTLQVKALLAGLAFGIWPLLMNRSGLNGNMSATVMVGVSLVCISPFALSNMGNLAGANWTMAIGGGIVAALGVTLFNGMLAKATPQNVSTLFVLMIVIQTSIPAIYDIFMNGRMTATKGAGFVLAIAAAILLKI